jgi:hypothetical protein
VLKQAQEAGRRLAEIDAALRAGIFPPLAPDKERRPFETKPPTPPPGGGGEPPDRERRPAIPILPISQVETPPTVKPPYETPEISGYEFQYEPVDQPTAAPPPTTYEVPTLSAYMPPTMPKISEVPTPNIQPTPTYETTPVPQPTPLPPMWWRLIPPSMFTEDSKEGAYKVQAGKKQVLLLA